MRVEEGIMGRRREQRVVDGRILTVVV